MMYSSYSDGMAHDHMQRRQQGLSLPVPDHAAYDLEGRRIRRPVHRRTVDHTSPAIRYIQNRMWQRDWRDSTVLQPTRAASIDLLPPAAYLDCPATSFATKFVHSSTNKVRCSINKVVWTPQGRRLITGSQSGEFTLWNGTSFNFEMILQAHDEAIGAMVWSHNENWLVTGDEGGSIKYWQQSMNNVKANHGHKEAVRDLSFSSTDLKFCSCSDDGFVKVWDFARCQEERSLAGHGWDVKSVDWHPQKSLLVSGGKDHLVKLWDAKTDQELCTLHGHKNTVLSVRWNANGNWVLTASKDQVIKLYDIRTLTELESYRGHQKDVTCLAWHPFHEELFVSGSYDGTILHWLVGHEVPQAEIQNAHENSVWDLAWHPMGHILCSRPGDPAIEKPGAYQQGSLGEQLIPAIGNVAAAFHMAEGPITPAAFVSGGPVRGDGAIPGVGMAMPLVQSSMESGISADTSRQQPGFSALAHGIHPRGPHPPSAPYPSVLASSQSVLQQVQVQALHQSQQQPLVPPVQQSQQLQQVQQMLPPPPPLPPPRRLAPPLPQQPPLPPGAAPSSVSSEPLLSRPVLTQSSSPLVISGQMASMIAIQGVSPQLQPQLGSGPSGVLPSLQPLPVPQYQGVGQFVASVGMQTGGLPLAGGQAYTSAGLQGHASNLIPSFGSTTYSNLQPPLPNTAPPAPDTYSGNAPQMMDSQTSSSNMGMQIKMGMNAPSRTHHPAG
ncbi:hypothetical protein KP509_13G042000 [Ceratopteris richardii]|uniref:Flowering time control protein FY n=1 Tax=Ceratopteris richardii TaxID=49495 RepID=A0A8T2TF33_CERRI|nr:hypothetical protein KP509_13G042000 [Ceratopteris richardii]